MVSVEPASAEEAAAEAPSRKKAVGREFLETLVLTAVVFLGIHVVAQNFTVDGHSMDPTLQNGQTMWVLKLVYWFHPARTGDIVVIKYPKDPTQDFIKRVIGMPGDKVAVHDGHVIVNGVALIEPYIMDMPDYTVPTFTVPAGNYWVLGDNRNNSNDSHIFGLVPAAYIIGQAWLTYWPPTLWGLVPQASFPNLPAPAETPSPAEQGAFVPARS